MTLSGHSAVEGVALHKETLPAALSVSFQHVDIGNRVLAVKRREEN